MKICLVTSAHLSNDPRLVKEADALAERGHAVSAIAVSDDAEADARDKELLAGRPWRAVILNFKKRDRDGFGAWLRSGLRAKFSKSVLGYARTSPELEAAARSEGAELFIAHNLQALPAAAGAAAALKARYAFDMEDYHWDEDPAAARRPGLTHLKRSLLEKYLPGASHLTVTSRVMADELKKSFRSCRPAVIYNVFPLSHAHGARPPAERPQGGVLKVYWYSQLIGLDRGLQDFIQAMPNIKAGVELHLRGRLPSGNKQALMNLAGSLGVAGKLRFLPPIAPEALVRDAAGFDIGLALEQPVSRNRELTATNKLFVYLLAGLAVAATDTPGQREVMSGAAGAGFLYRPGDARELAASFNALTVPGRLLEAKEKSWNAARGVFNWDREKTKLCELIERKENDGVR